jgi:sulfoacetaldehyde acetyltransferase
LERVKALDSVPVLETADQRVAAMVVKQLQWENDLDALTYAEVEVHPESQGRMRPRAALRALEKALPDNVIVATDIGNVCSVANSYLRFKQPKSMLAAMTYGNCGYSFPAAMGAKVANPDRPVIAYVGDGAWGMSFNEVLTCVREKIPVTVCVFHNKQWGAEKKNQVLWFGDRYVGTNLENPSFASIARSMGAEGLEVTDVEEVGNTLAQALENQKNGLTTIVELHLTRELGDPFRRDAMKLPQRTLKKYQSTNEVAESATQQPIDL